MLLLVLILVLIAFGLLVVALLSGSVLWAWVSVGVSVAAAAVLLVDWLQRRSAVKAGSEPTSEPVRSPAPVVDFEPVTEVLSVVPPVAPAFSAPGSGGGTPPSTPVPRFDSAGDGQQTVVMSVVQPSGSPARPPGAEPDVTSSGAFSSPSVTKSEADRTAPPHAPGGPVGPPEDADATVLTRVDGGSRPDMGRGPAGDVEATVMVDIRKPSDSGSSAESEPSAASATVAPPPSSTSPSAAADRTVVAPLPEQLPERQAAPAEPEMARSGTSVPIGGAPTGSTVTGGVPTGGTIAGGVPTGGAEPDAGSEPVVAGAGEAPEEPRDPAAAAIVAELDDEVVVVDEQPRYHVTGCRALVIAQPIPLPAREAVELGFTPCGWCSPDRTLAERHPAAAR